MKQRTEIIKLIIKKKTFVGQSDKRQDVFCMIIEAGSIFYPDFIDKH